MKNRIILVCGPWGSGTSAVAGALTKLGCLAVTPFLKVNDPSTPETFENLAFRELMVSIRSETTFKPRMDSDTELARMDTFCSALKQKLLQRNVSAPIVLKHGLAIFAVNHLRRHFDVSVVCVMRPLQAIENTRQRRGWTPNLGARGAKAIYTAMFNAAIAEEANFTFVNFPGFGCRERLEAMCLQVGLKPSSEQYHAALAFLAR